MPDEISPMVMKTKTHEALKNIVKKQDGEGY